MERMYRALFLLAGAGIAIDLLLLAINWISWISAGQPGPSDFSQPYSGPYESFGFTWIPTIFSVAKYFNVGAALMGAALAWADQRRGWFIALACLAAVAIVFPIGFDVLLSRPWFFLVHPRVAAWLGNNGAILVNLASLAPSALALVFAWRGNTGERQAARSDADAAMEITRSSL